MCMNLGAPVESGSLDWYLTMEEQYKSSWPAMVCGTLKPTYCGKMFATYCAKFAKFVTFVHCINCYTVKPPKTHS